MIKNWKLKLRYGKLVTPYLHFTLIMPVVIPDFIEDLSAKAGKAYAGVKVWASDADEAVQLVTDLASQSGFEIVGNIEIYNTDPVQPPQDTPYLYDINFSYHE